MSRKKSNSSHSDRNKVGFAVGASPYNTVKFELGLILVLSMAVLIAVDSITEDLWIQVLILGLCGISGFGWLTWRTRSITKAYLAQSALSQHTPTSGNKNNA